MIRLMDPLSLPHHAVIWPPLTDRQQGLEVGCCGGKGQTGKGTASIHPVASVQPAVPCHHDITVTTCSRYRASSSLFTSLPTSLPTPQAIAHTSQFCPLWMQKARARLTTDKWGGEHFRGLQDMEGAPQANLESTKMGRRAIIACPTSPKAKGPEGVCPTNYRGLILLGFSTSYSSNSVPCPRSEGLLI